MNTTIGGDLFTPEKIRDFHKGQIDSFEIPKWIKDLRCANCGEEIGILGIRNISLCLNASRLGDISVDIGCSGCSKSYSYFYRNACKSLDEFIIVLKSPFPPSVPEAQMSLSQYDNNLLEKMIKLHEKGLWPPK
jgi:hypothetical protein